MPVQQIQGLAQQHIDFHTNLINTVAGALTVDKTLIENCVKKYSMPNDCSGIIWHAILMVCDFVESVFDNTTWDEAVNMLTRSAIALNPRIRSMSQDELAECIAIQKNLYTVLLNFWVETNETNAPAIDQTAFNRIQKTKITYKLALRSIKTETDITNKLLPTIAPLKMAFQSQPGMTQAEFTAELEFVADTLKNFLSHPGIQGPAVKQAISDALATLFVMPGAAPVPASGAMPVAV